MSRKVRPTHVTKPKVRASRIVKPAPLPEVPVFGEAPAVLEAVSTDTREGLIVEAGAVLDQVDNWLPRMKDVQWTFPQGHAKLKEFHTALLAIYGRMGELLPEDSVETVTDIFTEALAAPMGTVPSLARPGSFVEWVGFVPVLFRWGGFLTRDAELRMVDPDEQFVNETGYNSLSPHNLLPTKGKTLRDTVRDGLRQSVENKKFKLHDVGEFGRNKAREALKESPFLQGVLKRGVPHDAIPLPHRLTAGAMRLFG